MGRKKRLNKTFKDTHDGIKFGESGSLEMRSESQANSINGNRGAECIFGSIDKSD